MSESLRDKYLENLKKNRSSDISGYPIGQPGTAPGEDGIVEDPNPTRYLRVGFGEFRGMPVDEISDAGLVVLASMPGVIADARLLRAIELEQRLRARKIREDA